MRRIAVFLSVLVIATAVGGVPVGAVAAAGSGTVGAGGVSVDAGSAASGVPVASSGQTAGPTCGFPLNATDATGTEVTLEESPDRIVALGGSAAQTVWEVGAADRVVGIDQFSTYLDGAGDVPIVSGGQNDVRYEQALNQTPDLVIVAGNSYPDEVAGEFRDAGVPTYKLADASSMDGIYAATNRTGALVGNCEEANATVASMRERFAVVEDTVERADDRPTIYYPLGSGYTVGPGSFIHDVMTTAGAYNVVANVSDAGPYPQLSEEEVIAQDPEWLLATYSPSLGQSPDDGLALLPASDAVNQTRAYEEGNVIAVDVNELNQPAPRIVEPMVTIAATLHPQAYAAANASANGSAATATPEPTATTAVTTTGTTGGVETTTAPTTTGTTGGSGDGGSLPGFGPAAAIAGLGAAAGALARRRA